MPAKESMTGPIGKALWFVEAHFARDITLDEIASIGGVSRYHMTRAFGAATGHSIMRYVRGRRLTEAESGFEADDAPLFERYDERFDPATGNGGLELWVPVRT